MSKPSDLPAPAPEPEGTSGFNLELYLKCRAPLREFIANQRWRGPIRVDDMAEVDDVEQQVYERMVRYSSQRQIENPIAYLFQVARHELINANKRIRKHRERHINYDEAGLATIAESRSHWIEEDGGEIVAASELDFVLQQLRPCERIALLRQRRDGWTHQQIAKELGVSVNTVKDYLGKAFNCFRIHFNLHEKDVP